MEIKKSDLNIITGFNKGELFMNLAIIPMGIAFFVNNDLVQWSMFILMVVIFGIGFILYFRSQAFKNASTNVKYWNTCATVVALVFITALWFVRILSF